MSTFQGVVSLTSLILTAELSVLVLTRFTIRAASPQTADERNVTRLMFVGRKLQIKTKQLPIENMMNT